MAGSLAETAKLVASLELKDRFTPAANKAMVSLGKLESRAFRVSQNIGKGLNNAAANIAKIGLVAGAGIALAVRGGIGHLVELENATTSVDGAIKQMGLTGKITSVQVATWANDIEASVGAAFDDKEIVAATATLLRFGKVTPSNLRPAMQVITDLAVKTGSVDSASSLLAKALADPAKAAGKLARSGVVLTKGQQAQIKAFIKGGKTAQAQKVILDALTATTKGAAAASQGPYKRAMSVLADVTEDAQKALATGFLPVLEKVAGLLSTELAKPQTLTNIRKFGEGLAGGLDKLIDIARGLPWAQIGASLKLAGQGAKTVLDMFTSMPPWVQTAILTGWGLNKLTGGALGGIVKELAGGLIKGVLGMNAGAVSIKAGVVTVAGGIPGVAGAGVAKGGLGLLSKVFLVGETIGLAALVLEVKNGITESGRVQAAAVSSEAAKWLSQQPTKADLERGLAGVEKGIRDFEADPIAAEFINKPALEELRGLRGDIKAALVAIASREALPKTVGTAVGSAIDAVLKKLPATSGTGLRFAPDATDKAMTNLTKAINEWKPFDGPFNPDVKLDPSQIQDRRAIKPDRDLWLRVIRDLTGKSDTARARGVPDENNKAFQELVLILNSTKRTTEEVQDLHSVVSSTGAKTAAAVAALRPTVAAVGTAVGAAAAKTALATQIAGIASALGTAAAAVMTASASTGAGQLAYSGSISAGSGVEAAIRASRPIITTNVQISATSVVKTNTVVTRYGNTGGDRDGGNVGVHGR